MLFSFLKAKTAQIANRSDKMAGVKAVLQFLDKEGLYPEFHAIEAGVNEAECVINGKKYLMFASNNYLGLTENPSVKKAAIKAIEKYGVGPGGSRVLSGNVDIIEELESKIADLVGKEACLTFPTGYMANISVFQALMDPLFYGMPAQSFESVIFSDEYNHGSIIDGCRLSKAKKVVFKHDDVADLLTKIKENNLSNKLIVTEGVFSTEGRITDLRKYVAVAKSTGSKLMVDDAHGVGILGKTGGGVPELQGCSSDIDIIMGSLDKAFGGTGGYLCADVNTIRFFRVACRSSILSSAIPTVTAASMSTASDVIRQGSVIRRDLFKKANKLKKELISMGFNILGNVSLPAIPLFVGEEIKAIKLSELLLREGIFSAVFRWPVVPEGKSRLRITVMASHSNSQLSRLVKALGKIGKELELI